MAKFGRIDVLVNNAAINPPTRTILNDTLEDWRRTIAINLEAVYMGTKLVAPHMVRAEAAGGSSTSPRSRDLPRAAKRGSYNAAKGGIIASQSRWRWNSAATTSWSTPWRRASWSTPMSIVNGVNETRRPDFIEWYVKRGKIPLRRTGYPEDVSGTVIFLASEYCRYMTGQLLVVDGGLMSTF